MYSNPGRVSTDGVVRFERAVPIEGTSTGIIKYSNYFDRQRHHQLNKSFAIAAVSYVLMLGFFGCGSSKETESLPVEERFAAAMTKFIRENYLEAAEDFKTVTVQYPGSAFADSAQFFIGECRYRREEFILAGSEYPTSSSGQCRRVRSS